jgi:hypothetical protein
VSEGRNPFEDELSEEELEAQQVTPLPDREAMSVIGDVAIPLDPDLAADVLLQPAGSGEGPTGGGSDPPIPADDVNELE